MANQGTTRNRAELFHTALEENALPGVLRYFGEVIGDGSPGAAEVFLNGEEGSRFYLPQDSIVTGQIIVSAWNVTDGGNPASSIIYFSVQNNAGTVSVFPTNFRATDGNPIVEFDAAVAGLTVAVVADDTNKAVGLNLTPTPNDTYRVAATMIYSFSATGMRSPNVYSVTN